MALFVGVFVVKPVLRLLGRLGKYALAELDHLILKLEGLFWLSVFWVFIVPVDCLFNRGKIRRETFRYWKTKREHPEMVYSALNLINKMRDAGCPAPNIHVATEMVRLRVWETN